MFSLFFSGQRKTNANKASSVADDAPTTSQGGQRSPYKFKKFSDDLHQPKNRHQHKRKTLHEKPHSQIATQKILRSIKRRQLQGRTQQQKPKRNRPEKRTRDNSRRRLNFLDNDAKKLPTQQQEKNPDTNSLEEGELVSDDEKTAKFVKEIAKQIQTSIDEEEDCICIEQPIVQITIDDDDNSSCSHLIEDKPSSSRLIDDDDDDDDDKPSCSGLIPAAASASTSKRIVRIIEQPPALSKSPVCNLRTSDARVKGISSSAPGSPSYAAVVAAEAERGKVLQKLLTSTPCEKSNQLKPDADNDLLPFFVDISSVAWFDTNNTSNTSNSNYTLGCSTLRDKTTKKRRSVRIKKRNNSDSDVIVLDDTTTADVTLVPTKLSMSSTFPPFAVKNKKRKSTELDKDDSVVFISETNTNQLPTYIPLDGGDDVPNPVKEVRNPFIPKRYKPINPLFTLSEKKQLDKYNDNAYNPDASAVATEQSPKRFVIVDGSNVAYSHALNKEFSVKGLKICLAYFEKMGHKVKAVVPQYRLQRNKSTEPEELERMITAGKIVLTPCKNLPGNSSSSYDDRFVLQLACELDAAIVSNDNYRDLIHENGAFKKVIENRVIGYSWCNDIFMVPKDPYGRWGPSLHTILNRD